MFGGICTGWRRICSRQKMPGADADYGHVTQTGFFYTVRGTKQETVIYCGDRWAGFAGNGNGFNQWCPVSFVNNKPYFNSLSQWHLDAETGEWWVGQDNNYVKNFSFDADRVNIPSANKPSQAYLRGWTTTVMKGNKVVIGDANSPVLNGKNSKDDRAKVMGNFCMNISDKTDFKRKVSQVIKSTTDVPLPDGSYALSCYVKNSAAFSELYMYAKVGPDTMRIDLPQAVSAWTKVELNDVAITGGQVEVGFFAQGAANAWCRIDDVSLVRKGDSADTNAISLPAIHDGAATYYSLDGNPLSHPHKGVNIVHKKMGGKTTTYKVIK